MEALRSVGNYKNHAIFMGVGNLKDSSIHTFRYDSYAKVLTEDKEKRVPSQEYSVYSMFKHEDWFYYTGANGKLMRVKKIDGDQEQPKSD